MKKLLASLALLWLALPTVLYAYVYHYVNNSVSVTDVSQSVPATGVFTNNHSGGDGTAFWAVEVVVRNTGSNEAFVDCDDGVATTADTVVLAGQSMTCSYTGRQYNKIGIIGSAGETTTAAVDAVQ